MKTRRSIAGSTQEPPLPELPDAAALSALRAWHEGLSSHEAVARFIPERRPAGGSSRSVIGHIRRQLAAFAAGRQREDLARLFTGTARKGTAAARTVAQAIEALRITPMPQPLIGDEVARWLPLRVVAVLRKAGIRTLAELTLRVPRRKRWWSGIAGLGPATARQIEAFFALHPELTERARALVAVPPQGDVRPWEHIAVPADVDGTQGAFRAPRASCSLRADNDYEAVQSWLALQEAPATQRAYRKEAERLLLWAIVERGVALSSLSTEDAVAYRAFLRHPAPRSRWIGPATARSSPLWRPFTGSLSPRSTAYALSVLSAMFRWLIDKRYVLANPFAGIRVRGTRAAGLDTARGLSGGEWGLVRTVADGLEWSYGWEPRAAHALRAGPRLRHRAARQRAGGRYAGQYRNRRRRRCLAACGRQGQQGRQGGAAPHRARRAGDLPGAAPTAGEPGEVGPAHAAAGQPRRRSRHHRQAAVGGDEASSRRRPRCSPMSTRRWPRSWAGPLRTGFATATPRLLLSPAPT
jgi:hypothetical protein